MEATATTLKIKLYVEERKTTDGRLFNTFKVITAKNGVKVTCKFTKDVKNIPAKSGFIFVDIDKINEQKNAEYPTVWVSEILGFEEFGNTDVEANRARMREMFGN